MITQERLNQATVVTEILNQRLAEMRKNCGGIGDPCVEMPLSEIKAFKDNDGEWRCVMSMEQLVYFIDGLLRSS